MGKIMNVRNVISACLIFGLLAGCATLDQHKPPRQYNGGVVQVELNSHAEVDTLISKANAFHGAENVLIVLDIDNTILTSDTDLGSDTWYLWQSGKLQQKPSQEEKVECLFHGSIGLLYELGTMRLTEPGLEQLIAQWQASNTVFALTSRSPRYRSATERELLRNKVDLTVNPLNHRNGTPFILRERMQRELSYMQGVMMTTGMDKGLMLKHILKRAERDFKAVIFVDDSEKNINNLGNAYANSAETTVHLVHYTRVEQQRIKEHGTVLTAEQAQTMAAQWKTLNTTLDAVFPGRKRAPCMWAN